MDYNNIVGEFANLKNLDWEEGNMVFFEKGSVLYNPKTAKIRVVKDQKIITMIVNIFFLLAGYRLERCRKETFSIFNQVIINKDQKIRFQATINIETIPTIEATICRAETLSGYFTANHVPYKDTQALLKSALHRFLILSRTHINKLADPYHQQGEFLYLLKEKLGPMLIKMGYRLISSSFQIIPLNNK